MKLPNFFKTHQVSIVSLILVALAAAFGADCAFAMAVDPAVLSAEPNPSGNMNPYDADSNPEGRPAGEALQKDELGGNTQLAGHAATATDVRDAGLEAEDFDPDIVNFRKFQFPFDTLVSHLCRSVKSNSYEHGHYRSASAVLDATYNGDAITISKSANNKTFTIKVSDIENPECLITWSTVAVPKAEGFVKSEDGVEISDGALMLFVLSKDKTNIEFKVLNPPVNTGTTTIEPGYIFNVCATAGSESQIRVSSEAYLPEKKISYLQKKIMTCIITDEFEEQDKKTGFVTKDVLANAMYNFRRKCERSHLIGTATKFQVDRDALGNREYDYTEQGVLRQIPMLYTFDGDMTDDDLMAITSLQFTENSASDTAIALCGRKALKRLMKLVNSSVHYKDIQTVTVNDYGIRVRKWTDNFGEIEFVHCPTLNDLGYEDFMAVLDLKNAVRYYKVNEKSSTQDMSITGEAEAKAHNKCITDCIALKGYNAVLVCPNSVAQEAARLGGIQASFVTVAALPSGSELDAQAKTKKYYLSADDTTNGFAKGTIVEWDVDLDGWKEFEGIVRG